MTGTELRIPSLVGGRRIEPHDRNLVRMTYDSGAEVVLPQLDLEDARRMLADAKSAERDLRELSIDDVTIFFDRAGRAWRDPDNPWRRMALEWAPLITGYAPAFVEWDVNLIGVALNRAKQYDFLESDLGDPSLLDDWNRTKAIHMRCWPKGLVTHVMVGNVPMASLFTLYRSLATKNVSIAKLPKRDPVTALAFANCLHDTEPDHPVARALSCVYWEPGSKVEQAVLRSSDVVSVWGQASAVEGVKRQVPYGTEVIEFGPKRSFTLIRTGDTDVDRLAVKMAYDTVSYDQEGCFSMQEAFVEGEPGPLVEALARALAGYAERFPRHACTPDVEALIQRTRMEATAEGWEVVASPGTDWTVIVTDGPTRIDEHPLSRVMYVHPVDDVADVLPLVDRDVQTVAVDPWDRVWEVADAFTAAGADRIVPVGRMARFRPGFIHDGFHPMRRMVRWVSVERSLDHKYRFMSVSLEEDEERIYHRGIRIAEETVHD